MEVNDMSMESPRTPVKVVFRIGENPLKGAISGQLAEMVAAHFNDCPVYALMPYAAIDNDGWTESGDMVRCFTEHKNVREEVAVEWKTIIRDTKPAEPAQYASLLRSLEEYGFEIESILATQVDTATRTMVRKAPESNSQPDEDLFGDDEVVSEDFVIEFDIVNDDLNAGFLDPEEWA